MTTKGTTEGLPLTRTSAGGSGAGATSQSPSTEHRLHRPHRLLRVLTASPRRRAVTDAVLIAVAVLDVWLLIPPAAPTYPLVCSLLACAALAARRWFPFLVVLATLPGFLVGWSELAAMLALGALATAKQWHWHVWVGAGLVWLCRFVQWPLPHFVALGWKQHVLHALYGVIVAGMPVAIGLLIGARGQLAARLTELAAGRERERRLHEQAVRAEERAKLARDMHDIISGDITLIAMQSGGLTVSATDEETRRTAHTIRQLSTHTLQELRSLLGMLRSDSDADSDAGEERTPDISTLPLLVRATEVPTELDMEQLGEEILPPNVSAAAYRTVQECLTNVGKHAPGAHASVRLRRVESHLLLRIHNGPDRTGQAPGKPGAAGALPSGGYGLAGLAERARLLGGSFHSEPTADGGFVVNTSYPLEQTIQRER